MWSYYLTRMARTAVKVNKPFRRHLRLDRDTLFENVLDATKHAPESIQQARWNAYGQITAAKWTAAGAILAVGSGAGVLWVYQQYISTQQDELKQAKLKATLETARAETAIKRAETATKKLKAEQKNSMSHLKPEIRL